jgi:multiple sugar transport system ATP-binding protein
MVRHPSVFLMDEPLSNLDAKLRVHMRSELTELHRRLKTTFIYVTHDQVEAMTMSDRVAMMDAGRILQLGTPAELYARPANVKVAQFIGSPAINILPVRIAEGRMAVLPNGSAVVPTTLPPGSAATIGLRPEALHPLAHGRRGEGLSLEARLRRIENLGADCMLHFDLTALPGHGVIARSASPEGLSAGDVVALGYNAGSIHLFDARGDRAEAMPAPHLMRREATAP